jgi:Tfp pilus assembly protein PilX
MKTTDENTEALFSAAAEEVVVRKRLASLDEDREMALEDAKQEVRDIRRNLQTPKPH